MKRPISYTVTQYNDDLVASVLPEDRGQIIYSRVDFVDIEGKSFSYVSFSKNTVEKEVRRYRGDGYSLMDERGRQWLRDIKSYILIVVRPAEPSKRRGDEYIYILETSSTCYINLEIKILRAKPGLLHDS